MPTKRIGKNVIEVLKFCRNCGEENPPGRSVYCSKTCMKEYYKKPEIRKKYAVEKKEYQDDYCGVDPDFKTKMVECICPKCRRTHKKKLLWTGRGKPRKYCWDCYEIANTIDAEAA